MTPLHKPHTENQGSSRIGMGFLEFVVTIAIMTASVLQAEKSLRRPSVVLDNPANARPITGMTGAPHPITLHGPVDRPSTLASAPATPPDRTVREDQPAAVTRARR